MSEPVRAEDSVLVFIDHQVLSMSLMRTLPLETVKANSIALVKAAQILWIPQADACVALGVSDQGSTSAPVYTNHG